MSIDRLSPSDPKSAAGERKRVGRYRKPVAMAALGASLLFSSCANLFSGEDIKAKIKEEVTVSTAATVNATITASPSSGGSLSLSGIVSQKVGVSFPLTATAFAAYSFNGWTATGDGAVVFSNAAASTTSVTINQTAKNIVITANYAPRPSVIDYSPTGTGVYRNQPIFVQFSKAMDTSTFGAGTISVMSKPNGVAGAPSTPIYANYSLSSMADGFMLSPSVYPGSNYKITITVSANSLDSGGNAMSEDFSWYFVTGSDLNTSVPVITDIEISKGHASPVVANQLPSLAWATNTTEITIGTIVDTTDPLITPQAIEITETDVSSGAAVTTSYGYDDSLAYDLQTSGTGGKSLSIRVMNSVGTWSMASSATVLYDTSPPADAGLLAGTAKAGGVVTLTWTHTGGADLDHFELTIDGGATITIGGALRTYDTAALTTGDHAFILKSLDAAGNASTGATLTAAADATAPANATGLGGTAKAAGVVTLAWTHGGGADLDHFELTIDGGAPITIGGALRTYDTAGLTTGSHAFILKSLDAVGNASTGATLTAAADATAPSVGATFQINGGSAYSNNATVAVAFTPTDDTAGDVEFVLGHVSLEANIPAAPGSGWTSIAQGSAYRVAHSILSTFATAEDTAFIYLYLRDSLGNTSATAIRGSVKYSDAPSISGVTASDSGADPKISFTNGSTAIAAVKYWTGDKTKTAALVAGQTIYSQALAVAASGAASGVALTSLSGDGNFTFLVVDSAGHESQAYGFVYTTSYSAPTARSLVQSGGIGLASVNGVHATSGRSGSGDSSFNWEVLRAVFGDSGKVSVPSASISKAPSGNAVAKVAYTPAMPEGRTREVSLRSTGILSETAFLSNELSEAALSPAPRVKEASEVLPSELASPASPRQLHSETLIHQAGFAPSSSSGAATASPPPPAPQPTAPDGGVPLPPDSAPRYALAPTPTGLEAKRRLGARFARLAAEK